MVSRSSKRRGRPEIIEGGVLSSSQWIAAAERFRRFLRQILAAESVIVKRWRGRLVIRPEPWFSRSSFRLLPVPRSVDETLRRYGVEFERNEWNTVIRVEVDQAACPQPMRPGRRRKDLLDERV